MKRRYIGIDQMYYFDNETLGRMQNIVDGLDLDGITKKVNWTGGGSFVTFELMSNNHLYFELINKATEEECVELLIKIANNPFALNYRCDAYFLKSEEGIEEFKQLTLEDKKRLLFELIDINTLYVNYEDRKDESFEIDSNDLAFMESFYKGE